MEKSKKIIIAVAIVLAVGAAVTIWAGTGGTPSDSDTSGEVAGTQQSMYQQISPEEVKEKMESGEPYLLLDVRSEMEYVDGHIEGAILIPDNEIVERAEVELTDKEATIFVYCRSGVRSERATRALIELGYMNVYDMGGIMQWPYETVIGTPLVD